MAMITITMFHEAAPTPIHDDAGMIRAFDRHAAVSVQPVMNVHVALGVMQRGDMSVRALAHRSAVLCGSSAGAFGCLARAPSMRGGSRAGFARARAGGIRMTRSSARCRLGCIAD
jgi:hypothetical protein